MSDDVIRELFQKYAGVPQTNVTTGIMSLAEFTAALREALQAELAEIERLTQEVKQPICNSCHQTLGDNWCADCAGRADRDARQLLATDLVSLADGKEVKTALAEAVRVKWQAELAEAVRLLGPFSETGRLFHHSVPDSALLAEWWPLDDPTRTPTVGDCRAAAQFVKAFALRIERQNVK